MTYHCNATGTKVTPDNSGRSQALWLHWNGESPPESTLGTGTGGHTGRLGTLDDRRGSFRRVQLWPEALANSELVNSTSCVVLDPHTIKRHPPLPHQPPQSDFLKAGPPSICQDGPILHRVRRQGRLPLRECLRPQDRQQNPAIATMCTACSPNRNRRS